MKTFNSLLFCLFAGFLGYSPLVAQSVDIGVVGGHTQTDFSSPASDGFEMEFYYEDDTATVGAGVGDGFSLDGGSVEGYDSVDSTSVEFMGFGNTVRNTVLSTVEGKSYTATFIQDGLDATYTSAVAGSLPSAPDTFYATGLSTSGSAAFWNASNQLVIDTRFDYTFNFNTYGTQPGYMSFELMATAVGENLDILEERGSGDSALTSYTLSSNTLVAGHLYDVDLFVANLSGSNPAGTLEVGAASMGLAAQNYQGQNTGFELIAVPEPACGALVMSFLVLGFGVCRSRRAGSD